MTELNNESMKTVVETFLIEETVELIYDNEKLDKWNNLVQELGLTGQSELKQPNKSPIPFMYMKTGVKNIFETLCPRKVSVNNYNATPIPLEVLDLVALSEKEGYFAKIEIWYDEKDPDPCCVGTAPYIRIDNANGHAIEEHGYFKTHNDAKKYIEEHNLEGCKSYGYEWNAKQYLIGRWADVKKSIKELREEAKERYISNEKIEFLKQIKTAQRGLDDLEITAEERFN